MLFVSKKTFFSQYYIASFRYINLFIRKSDISTFIFCILYIKINYLQRDVMDISSNDGDAAPHKFFNIPRKKLMRSHNLIMKHLLVFIHVLVGDQIVEIDLLRMRWRHSLRNVHDQSNVEICLSVTSMHTNCEGLRHNWWLLWQTFKI